MLAQDPGTYSGNVYLIVDHHKVAYIEDMRREDEDELANSMSAPFRTNMPETRLTDSKSVFAELPKMNEKPTMMVASGTSDASVLLLLKMSIQMKMSTIATTARHTASSFATADPTS